MPSKRFVVDRCGSGAALDQSNWTKLRLQSFESRRDFGILRSRELPASLIEEGHHDRSFKHRCSQSTKSLRDSPLRGEPEREDVARGKDCR